MHRHASFRVVVLGASGAALMWSVPAFAQSHSVPFRDPANTTRAAADIGSTDVVRVYRIERLGPPATIAVPANIEVSPIYRSVVDAMLQRSPTFRRQVLRIAQSGITIVIRPGEGRGRTARARTQIRSAPKGGLQAVVEVIEARDLAELIAHEIEHIIEKLDGVDYHGRALLRSSGITHTGEGFETTRAVRAGRSVAEEMREAAR
jgi:hypothetical protein